MHKYSSHIDGMYDDDGESRIRILFNDPIHKQEITGNRNIITQADEDKVCLHLYIVIKK